VERWSASRREEEDAVVAAEKQRSGNRLIVNKKIFPLKYTYIRRNVGRDVAYGAKAASPLMRKKNMKFTVLPMCTGQ
jgi:hypothetical protein